MVFNFNVNVGQKQQRATPKASDLLKSKSDGHSLGEPKQSVLDMDWHCQQWLCVVVTTDAPVIRKLTATPGQFGHLRHFNSIDVKRCAIKKLSWAHGKFDGAKDPTKPWDRYVTWSQTANRHDLRMALGEMLEELKLVLQKGGRLCMYDIEFEAGIVIDALQMMQLPDVYVSRWHGAATLGRPLLNLELLRWAFDYPSEIEPIELHKLGEHVLGKTVSSNEPGLQCWMLLRKMHVKVHEHTNKAKKRALGAVTRVDTPLLDDGHFPKGSPPQKAIKQMQSSNHGSKAAPSQSSFGFAVPGQAARQKFFDSTSGFIAISVEFNKSLTADSFLKEWRSGLEETLFGFDTKIKARAVDELRVARIVWACGDLSSHKPFIKKYTVRPEGFKISPGPNDYHCVLHNEAKKRGHPLGQVLQELFTDIKDGSEKGYRICAYGLEQARPPHWHDGIYYIVTSV